MTITRSTIARNAAANAVVDLLDAGSGAGRVEWRTGSKPASPQATATGTLLATSTLADPAFGSATGGVATASAIANVTAVASGTPGYFRSMDSDGNAVFDGTVTATGGGGDATFDSVTWVAGGTVSVSSFTYTEPAE